jgi:hypothetical protein
MNVFDIARPQQEKTIEGHALLLNLQTKQHFFVKFRNRHKYCTYSFPGLCFRPHDEEKESISYNFEFSYRETCFSGEQVVLGIESATKSMFCYFIIADVQGFY